MKIRHFLLTMVLLAGSSPSLIEATCCTCTPIANGTKTITINKPGNYALSGNISVPIVINASDVVLDLCTFSVTLPARLAGNAISVNGGKNNVTIKNGSVSNPGAAGIIINSSNGSVVENVEIFGSSQALVLSNSRECQINFVSAFNNLNKVGAVISVGGCTSVQLSNVQANNNVKSLTKGVINGDTDNAIISIANCFNVTLTDCSASFNNRSVSNTIFAPFLAVTSKSVSFINCLANSNFVSTTDTRGFAPFYILQCLNTAINGCQANLNNTSSVATSVFLRPIYIQGSNRTIITYCQVNGNSVSQFAVPNTKANQDLSGIAVVAAPTSMTQDDTVISHCQISGNSVLNGGAIARTQNNGFMNGIYFQGATNSGPNFGNRSVIEYCQVNGNSMGVNVTHPTRQFAIGINVVATEDLTISNCSADGNNGGEGALGINITAGGDIFSTPLGPCKNIRVLNTTMNNNFSVIAGSFSEGMSLSGATGAFFCTGSEVIGCQANGNNFGIDLHFCKSCSVIDCQANHNTKSGNIGVGIGADNSSDCTILNCSAKENNFGFGITSPCDHLLVQGNNAIGNTQQGFADDTAATSIYLSNVASNNGTATADNYVITGGVIQVWTLNTSTGKYGTPITGDGTNFSALVNVSQNNN